MPDNQAGFDLLDQSILEILEVLNAPGIAIGLTDRERLLHLGLYGCAQLESRSPLTADALFAIGSISKSFTAILLMQLWEAGRLDLHAPIQTYLPWFEIHSQYAPFSLHHLLSHTAGIPCGIETHTEANGNVWDMRRMQTSCAPGEYFHYSNNGYKLAGLVLEKLLGVPVHQAIQSRVLDPLGMHHSRAAIDLEARERLASGYDPYYDDRPFGRGGRLAPAIWMESNSADGSILSTAGDMCKYVRMLLNRGRGLLGEAAFERLTRPVITPEDGLHGEQYAYGLNVEQVDGRLRLSHSGGMVGYSAQMLADVHAGLGVIVLVNCPSEPERLAEFVLRSVLALREGADPPQAAAFFEESQRVDPEAGHAGMYSGAAGAFRVHERGGCLWVEMDAGQAQLERLEEEYFYTPELGLERFPLTFELQDGRVAWAGHGADWYAHERYQGPRTFTTPEAWEAYCGHYRAFNPWHTNFRVVVRRDRLLLIDQMDNEQTLVPLGEHRFRIGEDARSPESIRFEAFVDGRAVQAHIAGGAYCRSFTP